MGPDGKLTSLLPDYFWDTVLHSETKLWHDPGISSYLLATFATPEFMGEAEGENHGYAIETVEYCPMLGKYVEANFIRLTKKFSEHDARHEQNLVINWVMPTLKARLLRRKSKCTATAQH